MRGVSATPDYTKRVTLALARATTLSDELQDAIQELVKILKREENEEKSD